MILSNVQVDRDVHFNSLEANEQWTESNDDPALWELRRYCWCGCGGFIVVGTAERR